MRLLLTALLVLGACGSTDTTEPPPSAEGPATTEASGAPEQEPALPAPAPVVCGEGAEADSFEVVEVPFLSEGRLVIYTVAGPSGPNRSFAVCGATEEPLAFDTLPEMLGAFGLTLESEEARVAYAVTALRVRAADHIVLLDSAEALGAGMAAGEEQRAGELRRIYASEIHPPASTGEAPWTLVQWALTTDLLHIEVVLTADGGLTVNDTVREAGLPVPMRI